MLSIGASNTHEMTSPGETGREAGNGLYTVMVGVEVERIDDLPIEVSVKPVRALVVSEAATSYHKQSKWLTLLQLGESETDGSRYEQLVGRLRDDSMKMGKQIRVMQ